MSVLKETFSRPIAHRGLHDRKNGIIENSQTAFGQAITAGYGIECDLQLSGDGEPMVFHDQDLERLTGQSGRVCHLSAGQLMHIPLKDSKNEDCPQKFSQLLEQVAGAVPLVVEIKNQTHEKTGKTNRAANFKLARAAVELARDYEGALVFKSFFPGILRDLHRAGFKGKVGIIVTRIPRDSNWFRQTNFLQRFIIHNLLHYPASGFDFISCDCRTLDLPAVRLLRSRGFKVMTWTVSHEKTELDVRPHADQIVFENYLPGHEKG